MGFRKHKKLGKIYDSESKLVIDDMKTKIVLGRIEGEGDDEVFVELDQKAKDMADELGMKYNSEEQEEQEEEPDEQEEPENKVDDRQKDEKQKDKPQDKLQDKKPVAKKDDVSIFAQLEEMFNQKTQEIEQLQEDLRKSKDECAKLKRTLKSYLE